MYSSMRHGQHDNFLQFVLSSSLQVLMSHLKGVYNVPVWLIIITYNNNDSNLFALLVGDIFTIVFLLYS